MSRKAVQQPDFLSEISELQEQIDALKKRLKLVEDNRDKVRPKIYEKVKADYEVKLEKLFDALKPFKDKIQAEIGSLETDIQHQQQIADDNQEELEEYQLRFFAGEFSEEDFEPKRESFQSEIEKARLHISELETTIANFRDHLAFISGEPPEVPAEEPEPGEPTQDDEGLGADSIKEYDEEGEDVPEEEPDFLSEPEQNDPSYDGDTFLKDTSDYHPLADVDEREQHFDKDSDSEQIYIWKGTPVLDVVDGDFSGESYTIDKERITMGRGPNNDIQLATDTSVSRHHAQIIFENSTYYLVDLDSSNGSSVNGIRVSRAALHPNDEITIGVSKMIIRDQD